MKIKTEERGGKAILYHLWLSANETYSWAHKPNASWPCSKLSGHRLWVEVDQNGLLDFTVDGKIRDIPSDELTACISDHLPKNCRHLWPCWEN